MAQVLGKLERVGEELQKRFYMSLNSKTTGRKVPARFDTQFKATAAGHSLVAHFAR